MAKTTQTFYENSVYKFRDTEAEIDIDVFDNTAKGDITASDAWLISARCMTAIVISPSALRLASTINFCLTDP